MLHAATGVVQLGCEQGDGGPRGVPNALWEKARSQRARRQHRAVPHHTVHLPGW